MCALGAGGSGCGGVAQVLGVNGRPSGKIKITLFAVARQLRQGGAAVLVDEEIALNPIAFDTLKYANRLKQAGFSPEQAEALACALAEAPDAHQVELSTTVDIVSVSSALSSDIAAFKSELSSEFASLRADLAAMEARQTAALEKMGQTLFIRLGSLMTVLVGLLAIIIRMPR